MWRAGGPDHSCRFKESDRPDTAGQGQVKVLITHEEPPAVQVRPDDQVPVVHVDPADLLKFRFGVSGYDP